MIKQIIAGLVLGIFTTLIFVQYDPWVHTQIGNLFTRTLSTVFDCEVRGKVRTVNFLVPEIVFDDFAMIQKKDGAPDWYWTAKEYRTGFSWIDVVVNNSINMWGGAQDLAVTSKVIDNKIAIAPHIEDLMAAPELPLPLTFTEGYVKNGNIILEHETARAQFAWHATTQQLTDKFRANLTIVGGTVTRSEMRMLEYAAGKITFDSYDDNVEIKTDCQIQLCNLSSNPTVYLNGSWNRKSGRFSLESLDKSLSINPIIITHKQSKQWIEAQAKIPASYLCFLATNVPSLVKGECSIAFKGTFDNPAFFDGHIIGENLMMPLATHPVVCSSSFHKREHRWFGNMDVKLAQRMVLHGAFNWDELRDGGNLNVLNTTPLSINAYPYWKVDKQKFTCAVHADKHSINGSYNFPIHNELADTTVSTKGKFTTDRETGNYTIGAAVRDFTFDCSGCIKEYPYVNALSYYRDKKNPYIQLLHSDEKKRYEGMIQLPPIRALTQHALGYDVQGEGVLEFHAQCQKDVINTQFHLRDGTIRLPQTFNFINGVDGLLSVDLRNYTMALDDVACRLHTGALYIPYGKAWFDSAGAVSFCHVPLVFDHCLLNLKRDLFTVVSGTIALCKQEGEMPKIKGSVFLDRSQLKENIFSELFQKNLFQAADTLHTTQGVAVACDLNVSSKDPIRIDTGFLDAQAQLNISIKKQVSEPEIEGSISLLSGLLGFPYKPLHISRGKISFVKDQPLNPHIELVAKNNLKQHNIVLQVNGSVQDHFVILESTPPLTDEQIIGLLLAGSHEESLSAVIPSLLVQNVTNIIFSADQSGFLDKYVKPWLKQVNVHLVPKFSEESGRGGLRGSLEIDVNDRWRALIEKNFSLTEDTRFELEYLLSDDVRFRLIRDERCDVGTEVEMKWKF